MRNPTNEKPSTRYKEYNTHSAFKNLAPKQELQWRHNHSCSNITCTCVDKTSNETKDLDMCGQTLNYEWSVIIDTRRTHTKIWAQLKSDSYQPLCSDLASFSTVVSVDSDLITLQHNLSICVQNDSQTWGLFPKLQMLQSRFFFNPPNA